MSETNPNEDIIKDIIKTEVKFDNNILTFLTFSEEIAKAYMECLKDPQVIPPFTYPNSGSGWMIKGRIK